VRGKKPAGKVGGVGRSESQKTDLNSLTKIFDGKEGEGGITHLFYEDGFLSFLD